MFSTDMQSFDSVTGFILTGLPQFNEKFTVDEAAKIQVKLVN